MAVLVLLSAPCRTIPQRGPGVKKPPRDSRDGFYREAGHMPSPPGHFWLGSDVVAANVCRSWRGSYAPTGSRQLDAP